MGEAVLGAASPSCSREGLRRPLLVLRNTIGPSLMSAIRKFDLVVRCWMSDRWGPLSALPCDSVILPDTRKACAAQDCRNSLAPGGVRTSQSY